MTLSAQACGKLMIAGEYSVLFGGKSLVAACNYQAIARYEPKNHFEFYARTSSGFRKNNNNHLFLSLIKAARWLNLAPQMGAYYIDTSAFFNSRTGLKLGLGSSAAAIVSLAKIIIAQNKLKPDLQLLFKLASEAHLYFSSGLGSGADIASSVYEGIIEFHLAEPAPIITPIDLALWPKLIWVDTKRAQNTRVFVEKILDFAKSSPQFIKDFVIQSNFWCKQLVIAEMRQHCYQAFNELYALLRSLGERAQLDIISLEHKQIHDIARACDGVAKPSGAGGGDISIALVPEANKEKFANLIAQSKFEVIS
jgi:phosphomevalonate kinase